MRGRGRSLWWCLAVTAMVLGACDGGTAQQMGSHAPFAACDVRPTLPPPALGLDPFYVKYLDGYGTPVVSSDKVSDEALARACRITGNMVSLRQDVRHALAANSHRVAVIAVDERTTDIPEYTNLDTVFPRTDWNTYRAVSPTSVRPVSSTSEENLRCLSGDIYDGESALVWTLAHGVRDLGIVQVEPEFGDEVQAAYAAAMANDRWAGTSAAAGPDDYWIAGSLAWFGASTHLPVASREDLGSYDPGIASLLARYFPANDWRPSCYSQ